ncbi:MAG: fructosamine kinase family protein [Reichenbachiella sp.]|uniref:fructosamine kinase family protein n=1 Tax=Reichenbachiella sp. TaxID=2184521 RepID=UPI00329880A9
MNFLNEVIYQLFGEKTDCSDLQSVGGGCIHQAGSFVHNGEKYFLKWNSNASVMFETEAKGLALLKDTATVSIPKIISTGSVNEVDYLCLEFIEQSAQAPGFWVDFGRQLADLHQNSALRFGLDHHNFIGRLPQSNEQKSNWVDFFISERLMPQIKMARDQGVVDEQLQLKFNTLMKELPNLIPNEKPALLHGDLWSGNFLIGSHGQPVIFDPAVYYGHREAELAFTRLFGGFDAVFYQTYHNTFPLQHGHEERVDIFNLYPLLVHVNLFGSSYLNGIVETLRRFT